MTAGQEYICFTNNRQHKIVKMPGLEDPQCSFGWAVRVCVAGEGCVSAAKGPPRNILECLSNKVTKRPHSSGNP